MDSFATRNSQNHLLRTTAAAIAFLSWVSLFWTFYDYSWGLNNLLNGLISTSLYYSHGANLLIALYFSGVALGKSALACPRYYGHILIVIGILFAHYWIFKGSDGFWTSPLRSQFLHGALGPLLAAFYFVLLPKGKMHWRDAAAWTAIPLLYTFYGMTRGGLTGEYPYAVSDVEKHGYPFVLSLIAATTIIAWLSGMAIVALDKALAKGYEELAFFRAGPTDRGLTLFNDDGQNGRARARIRRAPPPDLALRCDQACLPKSGGSTQRPASYFPTARTTSFVSGSMRRPEIWLSITRRSN